MASLTRWTWVWVRSTSWWHHLERGPWWAAVHGIAKNGTWLNDWTEMNWTGLRFQRRRPYKWKWKQYEIAFLDLYLKIFLYYTNTNSLLLLMYNIMPFYGYLKIFRYLIISLICIFCIFFLYVLLSYGYSKKAFLFLNDCLP